MPKGDKYKLKADPEDGTTPIANLLLEAVAMAKISGLQKGAILYLWRRTYGWVGEDGKRLKECKISLSEWAKALNSESGRLSHTLAALDKMGIIKRRITDIWGGYYYSLNTEISKWNSNCINLSKLCESVGIADFATIVQNATVVEKDKSSGTDNSNGLDNTCPKDSATVVQTAVQLLSKTQQCTLYKEILNKDKEIIADEKSSSKKRTGLVYEKTDESGNPIKEKPTKKPKNNKKYGEQVGEVFKFLDTARTYKLPKRDAEAASIIRMLRKNYTVEQISSTWQSMKGEVFWSSKELTMMSVEGQIGAKLSANNQQDNLDKFTQGKFGSVVKR